MVTKQSFPAAKRLDGVGEYYFSQKLREIEQLNRSGESVINLGIGSPDLPPHVDVIEALRLLVPRPNVHAYQGYKGVPALRKAMSDWYQKWYGVTVDPDSEVLPLIGSKEGIMHICMTYINPGTPVLIPNPGYPTYSSAARIAGGEILNYHLEEANHWQPDFEELERLVLGRQGLKLMFVNYPHMPTGQLASQGLFEKLVAFAQSNQVLLIHDNPYSFILNDQPASMLSVEGAKDVVLELNSLSKSHNMAGWRVGMICGGANMINEVLRFKSNMDSGMFLPVQMAAVKALSLQQDWFDELNSIYRSRRQSVFKLLNMLECTYNENQVGMFVWARVPPNYVDGFALSDDVLNQCRVFITPGGIFGSNGNAFIRVSLCSDAAVFEQALDRLKNFKTPAL